MNRRGQALVEFIIILPILILILFSIFDFGNIMYNKSKLESTITDIINLISNDNNTLYNDVKVEVLKYDDKFDKVMVSKKVNVYSPVLVPFMGKSYLIKTERIIPHE